MEDHLSYTPKQETAVKRTLPQGLPLDTYTRGLFTQLIGKRRRKGKQSKKEILKALNA